MFGGTGIGNAAHMLIGINVPESVFDHAVDQLLVHHLDPEPMAIDVPLVATSSWCVSARMVGFGFIARAVTVDGEA